MVELTVSLKDRLLYILHAGYVEIRNLASDGAPKEQIADLADALEHLPAYLEDEPNDEQWEMVRFNVGNYSSKYPESGWFIERGLEGELQRWY